MTSTTLSTPLTRTCRSCRKSQDLSSLKKIYNSQEKSSRWVCATECRKNKIKVSKARTNSDKPKLALVKKPKPKPEVEIITPIDETVLHAKKHDAYVITSAQNNKSCWRLTSRLYGIMHQNVCHISVQMA